MSKQKLSAYILLDRSGSMSGPKWESAIGSINEYVETLKKEKIAAEVTVAAFDSFYEYTEKPAPQLYNNVLGRGSYVHASNFSKNINTFDIIRNKQSLKSYKSISHNELSPRGSTPLYDSTAKLLNIAEENNNEKTVIIIMTDGEENASTIYNIQSIKDRINTCKYRGWEVIFLGAEFNANKQAMDYGLGLDKVYNSSIGQMSNTMRSYATASATYMKTGAAIDTTKM